MTAWLWWAWLQVWPNLAANVIWVPVVAVHHILTRRHIRRLHHAIRQDHRLATTDPQEQ